EGDPGAGSRERRALDDARSEGAVAGREVEERDWFTHLAPERPREPQKDFRVMRPRGGERQRVRQQRAAGVGGVPDAAARAGQVCNHRSVERFLEQNSEIERGAPAQLAGKAEATDDAPMDAFG